MRAILASCLAVAACVTSSPPTPFDPTAIPSPQAGGGKGDSPTVTCGSSTCPWIQCAYNCDTLGQQCPQACQPDDHASAFVTLNATGSVSTTFDSRNTPYVPQLSADNVLIYGCQLVTFTDGHQGLELKITELIHTPIVVDPSDPARYQRKLDVFVDHMQGLGSYANGFAAFAMSNTADQYTTQNGCSLDVNGAADGGMAGTYNCTVASASGATAQVAGQFSCPGNALSEFSFVAWTPAM